MPENKESSFPVAPANLPWSLFGLNRVVTKPKPVIWLREGNWATWSVTVARGWDHPGWIKMITPGFRLAGKPRDIRNHNVNHLP